MLKFLNVLIIFVVGITIGYYIGSPNTEIVSQIERDGVTGVKITYKDNSGNYTEHFEKLISQMLNNGTLNPVELDNETWAEYVKAVNEIRAEKQGN